MPAVWKDDSQEWVDGMAHVGVLSEIAGVFLLACLSPGPVWMVITSTSVAVSRTAGVLTGLGVAFATSTWASVAMLGAGVLVQVAWLTVMIKLAGAGYLIWLGCRMIAGARRPAPVAGSMSTALHGGWTALRRGYLASITNPKAAAFFGSVFVVMLPPDAPDWVRVAVVLILGLVSAGWHCGLALVFSVAPIQAGYRRAKAKIDSVVGAVLVALGVRLAASR